MHEIFVLLLVAVLAASVLSFLAMGISQRRRARRLSRHAHQMGMRFSGDDPFDMPRRYAAFAVMNGGHSPQAANVTQGSLDGRPVRAFDLRYEVGHGTRRTTRHYGVVAAEMDFSLPAALAWHGDDLAAAPLALIAAGGALGPWRCTGEAAVLDALRKACKDLAPTAVSIETSGQAVLFCLPVPKRGHSYSDRLEGILEAVRKFRGILGDGTDEPCGPDRINSVRH